MKQKIKDFLLRKRFLKKGVKVLKNKKGFSLLEVLIGVAIIGIVSAIAVPQFISQKNNAAKVASDTSAGNIAKAFKTCLALKSFDNCKKLNQLDIDCPNGSTCESGGASGKFCAHLHRGDAGSDFKVCISVDSTGTEIRSYGGALLSSVARGDVCHHNKTASPDPGCSATSPTPMAGLIPCTSGNVGDVCGTTEAGTGANCGDAYTCATPTTVGDCDDATGNCS